MSPLVFTWRKAKEGARHLFFAAAALAIMIGGSAPVFAQSCTGLCLQQVQCANPLVTTTISGKVFAPNGTLPLPNVLVYVPNAPVQAFDPGVACGVPVSGDPLVSTFTDTDGTFT